MAQTTEKIRFVYGAKSKYSSTTHAKDLFFATDTQELFARGKLFGMGRAAYPLRFLNSI